MENRLLHVMAAGVLGLSVACSQSTISRIAASENSNLWMALAPAAGESQDIYLSSPGGAKEMGVCVIENPDVSDTGFCLPAEKAGKFFKISSVKLNTKMALKIQAKDEAGIESTRKVKFTQNTPIEPIPESMNLALKAAGGSSVKVADVFQKKYLLIEFSAYDCGPCRSFAQNFNTKQTQYAKYFEQGQCSKMVLVNDYGGLRGRLSDWVDMLGGSSSYLGKVSYASNMGLGEAARQLGFHQSFGIPTLIMLDRSGKVVDSETGNMPSRMNDLCVIH